MVYAGYRSGRLIKRAVFAIRATAELLGKKSDVRQSDAVLSGNCRTWFINGGWHILSTLAHAVELDEKCFLSTGNKLDEASIYALERVFCQRFLSRKNGLSPLFKIEDMAHSSPSLQIAGRPSTVSRCGEDDRQPFLCEHTEITLACLPCAEVCGIQYTVVIVVTILLNISDPSDIISATIHRNGPTIFVKRPPAHKFLNVLDLDKVRGDGLNVAV